MKRTEPRSNRTLFYEKRSFIKSEHPHDSANCANLEDYQLQERSLKKPQYTLNLQQLHCLVQHCGSGDKSEEEKRLRVQDKIRSERTEVTPGSNPSYTFNAGESAVHRQPRPPLLLECQLPGAVREGQPRPPHHVLAPHLVLCTLHHHLLIQNQLHCQHYAGDIIEKAKQMTTATLCQVFLQKRGDLMSHLNQLIENSSHDLKNLPEVLD